MDFDFTDRESKAHVTAFINKYKEKLASQAKKQPSNAVSGGNSLIARIKNIEALTQERFGHLADKYEIIKDRSRLKEYIDKAVANGIIAIDTETTGLNPITDKLVGVCLYTPDEKPCYVPINHVGYVSLQRFSDQLTEAEVGEEMVRCKDLKCVFFNAKFDTRVMKNHLGFWCPIAWDGYIGAKLLDAEYEEEYNLKYLWAKYCAKDLNSPHYTFEKLFKGINFSLIPIETAYLYASNDAIITYELYEYQKELLDIDSPKCKELGYDKLAWVMKNIELPLIPVVAQMEENGVSIDKDYAKKLSEEYNAELEKINERFLAEVSQYNSLISEYRQSHPKVKLSDPINVGSPSQLGILLWDILKLTNPIKKKQGKTDNEVLSAIDNPIAKIVLEYRTVSKLISTYIDKLPDEVVEKTGKIHASFNQYGAATGRFSSSDPNLQNIPSHDKKIRKMFVASSFDKVTVSDEIELLLNDEIETERGRVKTQDLATGNIIKGENGNAKIIGIIRDSEDDRFFKVRIYHETPRFLLIVYRRYVMYSADFSQQEPGITSSLSDDPKMIGAFVEGKDIYATIASIAFNRDYLDCLGPENMPKDCGREAHPEGKKYRGRAKAIVLGICYGKSIPSIAEDLGVTKQEAQEIYDKVMTSFVNLKKFMEDSQSFAHKYGYVETMYGRRRPIPDMQLDPYELKPSEEKYFDPFFDSEKFGVISVADKKMSRYKNELLKCKFYKAREDLKAKIFNDGFIVTDNTQKVEDATRQCVNCVDNQTEILTKSGWKKFNELFVGQEIMAINTVTGDLECTRIEKLHQHWGRYQMLEYKDDYIDICCTENHRIPIKQIKDEDGYFLTFADASDVCGDTTFALQDNKLIEVQLPYNGFSKGKVANFVWCVTTGTGTWIARRNGKIYITGNSRVQGSAADLSKMAMYGVGVSKELKKFYFRLLLMVHDEVIGESPEIFRDEVAKLLETIMVGACKDLKVPAHVDVDISYKWYENE